MLTTFKFWFSCFGINYKLVFKNIENIVLLIVQQNYLKFFFIPINFEGILTEARSKEAQVHNISCTIKVLEKEYLQTSLSHISPKSFVDSEPIAVYNLLEIFDGLTEFMIDYMESKTSKQGWFVKNNK